jgi:hypothetical protein
MRVRADPPHMHRDPALGWLPTSRQPVRLCTPAPSHALWFLPLTYPLPPRPLAPLHSHPTLITATHPSHLLPLSSLLPAPLPSSSPTPQHNQDPSLTSENDRMYKCKRLHAHAIGVIPLPAMTDDAPVPCHYGRMTVVVSLLPSSRDTLHPNHPSTLCRTSSPSLALHMNPPACMLRPLLRPLLRPASPPRRPLPPPLPTPPPHPPHSHPPYTLPPPAPRPPPNAPRPPPSPCPGPQ